MLIGLVIAIAVLLLSAISRRQTFALTTLSCLVAVIDFAASFYVWMQTESALETFGFMAAGILATTALFHQFSLSAHPRR